MSEVKRYYIGVGPSLVEMTKWYREETGFPGLVKGEEYDRLEQECEALKGLYRMHKETESREAIELKQKVDDLSMLVRQLVQALRKSAPEHALPAKAMGYLQRKGLQGSPLRIGDDL